MSDPRVFTLLPMLPAVQLPDGRVLLTRKFVDGLLAYEESWDGRLRVVMEPAVRESDNLDNLAVDPRELPFELHVLPFERERLCPLLAGSSVVLGGLCHRQLELAELCRELDVPCVYTTEYTLRTRRQWALADERNPLRLARRWLWEGGLEKRYRRALELADGLQANGTPTFEAYADLTPYPILFFDSRLRREMVIGDETLDARLAQLTPGRPLRLAFSGRLIPAKGVVELLRVARELERQNVRFELSIFGGGPEEARGRKLVKRWGLESCVFLRGVRDYRSDLSRTLCEDFDLFVCCHRQGDPSCTYLETFGCGLPIVGYSNEALDGLLQQVQAGATVEAGNVSALTEVIRQLWWRPESIARWSHLARGFAREHHFEETFERRMDHIKMIADQCRRGNGHGGVRARA